MLSIDWNSCIKLSQNKKDLQYKSANKYNLEDINFPSEKDDWNKFEKTNVKISLNILQAKKEKIHPVHVSKHNSNCKKQVILLMIPNGEKIQHYLAVKKPSALLKEIKSKNNCDFFCLRKKTNLNHIKKYAKTKIFVAL